MSSERIKSWPTKERPRERLLAEGPERLTDSNPPRRMPALNTIHYGPPGTGKTYTLQKKYMELFTEIQMVTREQFAQELAGDMTWLQVITVVLYDLKSAKVPYSSALSMPN